MRLDGKNLRDVNIKMKQIYKNLYEEEGEYFFIFPDGRKKQIVEQQGYLSIYLIEIMGQLIPKESDNE